LGVLDILDIRVSNQSRETQTASPLSFARDQLGEPVKKKSGGITPAKTKRAPLIVPTTSARRVKSRRISVGNEGSSTRVKAATVVIPIAVEPDTAKPVRNYRRHTKKLISESFSDIMKNMAKDSIAGSLAHTKYLFDIGGVKEDIQRKAGGKGEPSLAELLLAEVRKQGSKELSRNADEADRTDSAEVESKTSEGGGEAE
jgi:hypothetical protein